MANNHKKLPRELLAELMERSGLSGLEIAKQAGYRSASGFYRLMQAGVQKDKPISHEAIKRLIPVLRGRGNPAITIDELLAISDASTHSLSPALGPALSEVVTRGQEEAELIRETGGDLLPIKLRVERGVFVHPGQTKVYGVSMVGVSREFRPGAQFVAVVMDDSAMPAYRQQSQLHCVLMEKFALQRLAGRRVVVWVRGEAGPYSCVAVARVDRVDGDELVMSGMDGQPVHGELAGVIVGAYNRE